jgi:hypothetical protein
LRLSGEVDNGDGDECGGDDDEGRESEEIWNRPESLIDVKNKFDCVM